MRVPLAPFVEPGRNDAAMAFLIAASVFVFAYSFRFGPVAILFYYALWFPFIALLPGRVLAAAADGWPILLFAAFAISSVLWSQAPGTTLRAGVQLATHAACVLAAARLATLRGFTLGLVAGTLAVLVWSVLFGRSSYDPLDGSYTFVGLFGSKNQLGFFASLGVLAALFALTFETTWPRRAGLMAVALFALAVLAASDSATAILTLAVALATLALALALRRLATEARLVLALGGGVFLLLAIVLAVQGGAVEMVLGAFGKDTTLTGRTYLWSEGLGVFTERPWTGTGYSAFWVQGLSHAERLWEEFFIGSRSGFHFHNTWIEVLAELGVGGAALLALVFTGALRRAVTGVVRTCEPLPHAFVLALVVLLLARSMSEVDAMTPFAVGSFILFFLAVFGRRPVHVHAPPPGWRVRLGRPA